MPTDSTAPADPAAATTETVQLFVSDEGNRRVIAGMLEDDFSVETGGPVGDADLYLVEDQLLPTYRDALRSRVAASHPTFCPVVVIRRRPSATSAVELDSDSGTLPLIDEFVDAPIDRGLLVRRLRSLLVRRRQSEDLARYVSTLEERERDLRRFERAVEDAGNGIALLDTDGTIRHVNSAFEETTGYPEPDAVGEPLRLLRPDEVTFDDAFWRTMRGRGAWEGELVAERRNGTQYVADATITTISTDDGDTDGFAVVLRDITERIQREETLREREEELDLLRQVLTRYLRHNLRNDLNVILGYAEFIAETGAGEIADDAGTIIRKTERLLETSDTARRYSALIERGDATSRYDLSAVVTDAVDAVREAYPEVDVDVDAPDSCRVVAGDGVRDVVTGLVDNAAAHNDGSDPRIRVRLRARDRPVLTIEDNGPGIPDRDLAAFDAGNESPLTHSTGVGVWLSKWVIEGSGGDLSFDTGPEGTLVTIEFPATNEVRAGGIDVTDLKAREQRLRTIIDRMTDAVLEVDGSWEVTFLDAHAADVLGVDADAVVDCDFWTAFPEIEATEFETVYREVMASRSADHVEAYYGPIDGWLEVYVYPDFDGGLSFYFRDITERKSRELELEHRQRTLRAVYEIVADRDRSFREQVSALLELGREELGTAYGTLSRIDGDDYVFEIVAADDDTVQSGDVVPLSTTNCEVAAGEERTLVAGDIERDAPELTGRAGYTEFGISCYVGAPVFVDSEVYGTFCFYGTEPLADQFSEWEVTLVDLMSRWVSYGLQAQQAGDPTGRENERLDQVASIVSHDLRNPLSVAGGYVRLARETGDAAYLDRAESALDRLWSLIDDLLELARSDDADPETEAVDLRDVVERSWEVVPTDGATLDVATGRRIRAEPTMLERLVENVVHNAAARGSGGVTVTVSDVPGGFAVADDGLGVPAADRERVFETGDSTGDDGTGAGLLLVREVAEAHGWAVTLTESERGGARYEITDVEVVED
jgi:PAS domain S-box-containing protein